MDLEQMENTGFGDLTALLEESTASILGYVVVFLLVACTIILYMRLLGGRNASSLVNSRNISAAVYSGEIREAVLETVASNAQCIADLQKSIAERQIILNHMKEIDLDELGIITKNM